MFSNLTSFSSIIGIILILIVLIVILFLVVNGNNPNSQAQTSTESDDGVRRVESVVTNIFGKGEVRPHRIRRRTRFFIMKLKVFCALHKPATHIAKLYHFVVLVIIFFSIIALNIIDEQLGEQGKIFNTNITYIKVVADTIIIVILSFEFIVRLWTCDVVDQFKGRKGIVIYLKAYAFWRALDVFGIIVFFEFILNHIYIGDNEMDSYIRICHLTQVLQLHRLMYRVLRVMIETIKSQMYQLIIVMIFAFLTLILTAFCIYLTERDYNKNINKFFDAFWMTFITFSTIGYGDIYPDTKLGKILIMMCTLFGFVFFALPGSILGTGLALQIQEGERRKEYYTTPASKLIQSVWRCYASNQRSYSDAHWKVYRRKDGQALTAEDRACIRFIRSIAYLKQRHRFKVIIGLVNDDFFRERSTRELSLRLKQTEINIKHLGYNINKTLDKKFKTNDVLNKLISKVNEIKEQIKNKSEEKD